MDTTKATASGVRPARQGEGRHTICCIHNATQNDRHALLEMSTKIPDEITKYLAQTSTCAR